VTDDVINEPATDSKLVPAVQPEPTVEIKVTQDIEQMTWGRGNHLNFFKNIKYTVPLSLARHLDERGYVWGGLND